MWSSEADSPLQAFNSIRDNSFLEKYILNLKSTEELGKLFDWIEKFIISTWNHSAFSEVLSTLAQYFAENLQHERFGSSRMKAMEIILLVRLVPIIAATVSQSTSGTALSSYNDLKEQQGGQGRFTDS